MGDSSGSEEFYDAEDVTPLRGSKRSSLCKSIQSVTEIPDSVDKEKALPDSTGDNTTTPITIPPAEETPEDDRTTIKNVVQGRRRFQELRRCMQTEEEDDDCMPDASGLDHQTFALEHPFKIISHDTLSLPSMTSLGRIGRILGGVSESQSNIRDNATTASASSKEPSTISDDPIAPDSRNQTVLAMAEPDVIASTKANSLKHSRGAPASIVAVSGAGAGAGVGAGHGVGQGAGLEGRPASAAGPVAPPRRKKRGKLHDTQSLWSADTEVEGEAEAEAGAGAERDADSASVRAAGADRPHLDALHAQSHGASAAAHPMALPSPASTIESLTREFQDSLELSLAASDRSSSASHPGHHSTLDIKQAVKGDYIVRPHDDARARSGSGGGCGAGGGGAEGGGAARTHSETRAVPATGHSSLGAATRRSTSERGGGAPGGGAGSRRRSAGDEAQLALGGAAGGGARGGAAGAALRTRTVSGHQLTDIEILEQVTVLNLDTGERVPLSVAEHKLPQCINPLSLHIMRLTSEYIGRPNDEENASQARAGPAGAWRRLRLRSLSLYDFRATPRARRLQPALSSLSVATRETDEESECVCTGGAEDEAKEIKRESADRQITAIGRKTAKVPLELAKSHSHGDIVRKNISHESNSRIKRFFGSTMKRTVHAARSLAQEVTHARHKEDVAEIPDEVRGDHNIKLKASNSHKGPYDFDGCVRHVQEMGSAHCGAVWCCKFSVCGRLLATAGQDRLLRVWVARDAHHVFQEMRTKYNAEKKSSPTPSQESLPSLGAPPPSPEGGPALGPAAPFHPEPFCVYSGHTSDLLDVSWSKNYFILSSSMDKTVRLWHISRGECLCCFQHIDFVTAIVFHPRDDRYFLSGSLDGKLRLWNIPDKKVAVWNEVDGKTKLITAANFCQNGKFAVVGTYDGRCIFYTTDELKYHTQLDVRSTRGKNSTGRKISGIEPMPNDDKVLVTSNDSRIRLYDLRDLSLSCKYRGYVNVSSQIKASFSHDGKYIVSGSENQCIYIWKTHHDYGKFTSVRRDRNDYWEGIKAHSALVTCAVFAPNPDHVIRVIAQREAAAGGAGAARGDDAQAAVEGGMVASSQTGHVLVSADFNGCIKVFVHKAKPKHSSLPASALA